MTVHEAPPEVGSWEDAAITIEVADAVIRRIFTVGLSLAAAASTADQPTAGRITAAVAELDAFVRCVRRAAYKGHVARLARRA